MVPTSDRTSKKSPCWGGGGGVAGMVMRPTQLYLHVSFCLGRFEAGRSIGWLVGLAWLCWLCWFLSTSACLQAMKRNTGLFPASPGRAMASQPPSPPPVALRPRSGGQDARLAARERYREREEEGDRTDW
ncbi:hypothetical protein LY76DRAFT_292330 [Colletotrichum caudatum]|nr:hypothetical protein LY76DRAFT_292330 [Colletotrichum caudatum]